MLKQIFSLCQKVVPKQIRVTTEKCKLTYQLQLQLPNVTVSKKLSTVMQIQDQNISKYYITKTITYVTKENSILKFNQQTFKLANPTGKPLCLMLTWLNARDKDIDKYLKIYLEWGFDVLTVAIPTLHLLFPPIGFQVTAAKLVKFLHFNNSFAPLMLHGFSSGSCIWGEVSKIIAANRQKYQSIRERVICQVWDSAIDKEVTYQKFAIALFPKNVLLQSVGIIYGKLHLLIFSKMFLIPMQKAYLAYLHIPCPAPALIFVGSIDPIGTESGNRMLSEKWKSLGIKVTFKCWDKSPHVQHLISHRKEYVTLLYNHIDQAGLLKDNDHQMCAKLNYL